jgi:hypothetical protein
VTRPARCDTYPLFDIIVKDEQADCCLTRGDALLRAQELADAQREPATVVRLDLGLDGREVETDRTIVHPQEKPNVA